LELEAPLDNLENKAAPLDCQEIADGHVSGFRQISARILTPSRTQENL
jgi:hypothetical protein